MDKRTAEEIIKDYIFNMHEPINVFPESLFANRSYSLWAANEILDKVRRNYIQSPIEIVSEFKHTCTTYSYVHPASRTIFMNAERVASDILERLIAAD